MHRINTLITKPDVPEAVLQRGGREGVRERIRVRQQGAERDAAHQRKEYTRQQEVQPAEEGCSREDLHGLPHIRKGWRGDVTVFDLLSCLIIYLDE